MSTYFYLADTCVQGVDEAILALALGEKAEQPIGAPPGRRTPLHAS